MEMPANLAGVGMTCRSMVLAAARSGVPIDLFTSYIDGSRPAGLSVQNVVPDMLKILPFRVTRPIFTPRLRARFLRSVNEGDVAYLWPSAGLPVYEALAKRGVTIVAETVNTRMYVARPVLDAAYDSLGLEPGHGITDARIADQNARHALCTAIFAPSPIVEESFAGSTVAHRIVSTSYGTWTPGVRPARSTRPEDRPVVFLFVGKLCVRKGAHLLLEAWRRAPKGAVLRIVGEIEPVIRTLFADVLSASNVSCAGFTSDVGEEFHRADVSVLPSLEEGDPIATYEAAAHGLPVIASRAGAGRIGAETGAINVVEPADVEMLRARFSEFADSEALRRHWGDVARQAACAYDWGIVAPLNMQRLFGFLDSQRRL